MNRRRFIAGLGTATLGGAAIVSSGAFSEVEVQRTITVAVVNDRDAFLRLDDRIDNDRSRVDNGTLSIQIPGLSEPAEVGDGLGTDSVYEFDGTGFNVRNQGSLDVDFWAEQEPSNGPSIEIYDAEDQNRDALTKDDPYELDVGEDLDVGLRINTFGVPLDDWDETLIIRAEER